MIDEENELTFQVQIEGTRPGEAKCRLMLETEDMSLAFSGRSNGEEVEVILPPLDHVLKEGTYDMTLEVMVDDRYFEPLKIQGDFEKRLKVTAESVRVKTKPRVSTSASLVEVKRKEKEEPKVRVRNTTSAREDKKVEAPIKPRKKKVNETKTLSDKDIMNLINKLAGK
tara:strand:- start:238 stop:744 length:507 start_codon:yes stop_codon:yes gene_type:complete